MGTPDLLHALQDQGLRLWADGDRLMVAPRGRLTDETRTLIRQHKAELLSVLESGVLPDPSAEAHRQRGIELAGHLRMYADCNGFTQADFEEAMQVAMAGDLEGWIAYLEGQNETRH